MICWKRQRWKKKVDPEMLGHGLVPPWRTRSSATSLFESWWRRRQAQNFQGSAVPGSYFAVIISRLYIYIYITTMTTITMTIYEYIYIYIHLWLEYQIATTKSVEHNSATSTSRGNADSLGQSTTAILDIPAPVTRELPGLCTLGYPKHLHWFAF